MQQLTNQSTEKVIQEIEARLLAETLAEVRDFTEMEQALAQEQTSVIDPLADALAYIQASGRGVASRIVALNQEVA